MNRILGELLFAISFKAAKIIVGLSEDELNQLKTLLVESIEEAQQHHESDGGTT